MARFVASSLRQPVRAFVGGLGLIGATLAGSPIACQGGATTSDPQHPSQPVTSVAEVETLYQTLESNIDARRDSDRERKAAHDAVARAKDDGSANYAFLRAALAGRYAETRGLKAIGLVREAERWGREAYKRDPNYRDGEAQRLLGSLLALAGPHVAGLDAEEGIELLQALVDKEPQRAANQLRLAQALQSSGDDKGAQMPLCLALQGQASLRPSEVRLLDHLVEQAGGKNSLSCPVAP